MVKELRAPPIEYCTHAFRFPEQDPAPFSEEQVLSGRCPASG
jgi:hypothetical protein